MILSNGLGTSSRPLLESFVAIVVALGEDLAILELQEHGEMSAHLATLRNGLNGHGQDT